MGEAGALTGADRTMATPETIEANWIAYYGAFRAVPDVTVEDRPEYVRMLSGVPSPFFNAIFRARFAPAQADAQIEEALAPFKARGLPLVWVVGPTSQPADLGARLEAHGLVHALDETCMALDLRVPADADADADAADLEIRAVEDEPTLRQWAEPVTVGFELGEAGPDGLHALYGHPRLRAAGTIRSYVGLAGGAPVAAATVFLGAAEAGIYSVATVPAARRQGFATALTARALAEARTRGFRTAVLQSTAEGLGVYRRLGFRGDSLLSLYFWLGSEP